MRFPVQPLQRNTRETAEMLAEVSEFRRIRSSRKVLVRRNAES